MPQQHVKVYCRRKNRIDALLDEVLQLVLSFLPAWEAVRTCMLAGRWRYLWRSMPALRITSERRGGWLTEFLTENDLKQYELCEQSGAPQGQQHTTGSV
uniref:F-box domain-containing protein n=1 Tax=Arundo donax TaxID=35708 RepID=A0A0A9GFR0_ARUDO